MKPSTPIRVFIGVDERQPVGLTVLAHSIAWRSSHPVAIQPLILSQLPIKRRGLTSFTFSRFLVPWLCGYEGKAIFMDADILVNGDIKDLALCGHGDSEVLVMQDQPRFEWPSVMVFNNPRCRILTPEYIDDTRNNLFDFGWAKSVGTFPAEWNRCVGYKDGDEAKLYHYTQGLPVWPETRGNFPEDRLWLDEYRRANATVAWKELMGSSVHAPLTMKLYRARTLPEDVEFVTGAGNVINQ
jgi:hypothetical protein